MTAECRGLLLTAAVIFLATATNVTAQTAERFNLTCAPLSSAITGTDTFGQPLSAEDYQGVIEETILRAVDLKQGTACHPDYCTPDTFGGPGPLSSVTAGEIVFDDIVAREVESNEYNIIAYYDAYDRATRQLTTTFRFYAEDQTTEVGKIVLKKACVVSDYALKAG